MFVRLKHTELCLHIRVPIPVAIPVRATCNIPTRLHYATPIIFRTK